jgi:Flp pilus assembly protein TadD
VTLWLFVLGGAAAGLRARGAPALRSRVPLPVRLSVAVAVAALAAGAVVMARSQDLIDRSQDQLTHGTPAAALADARAARDLAPFRSEPYELMAYASVRLGDIRSARRLLVSAIEHDPGSWRPRYGAALVQTLTGHRPDRELRILHRLNPLDPRVIALGYGLSRTRGARGLRALALASALPYDPANPVEPSSPPALGRAELARIETPP